jgi:Protein of unknown function (DUF3176)
MSAPKPAHYPTRRVQSTSGEEHFQEGPDRLANAAETDYLNGGESQLPIKNQSVHQVPAIPKIRPTKQTERLVRGPSARFGTPKLAVFHAWRFEILSCLLFVLSLVAIFVTIYSHQGRPLPQWPYSISINSLVAIYVVILKAAMLFVAAEGLSQLKWSWFKRSRPLEDLTRYDMASRGAWGAVRLLWTLRGRDLVASIGAVVTIAALAIDPFAQQIIHYYTCQIELTTAQAAIPRTNLFYEPGLHDGNLQISISTGMQSAVNIGVFQPAVDVRFDCLTGNCTFAQPYHSVGYCSHCSDISSELRIANLTHSYTVPTDLRNNFTEVVWEFNTSLPSGLSVINGVGVGGQFDDEYFAMGDPAYTGSIEIIRGASRYNISNRGSCHDLSNNDTWPCQGYGAARCTLKPCIKTYTANVSAGNVQESLISTFSNLAVWDDSTMDYEIFEAAVDVACLSSNERQSLIKLGYKIEDSTQWLPYNQTWDPFPRVSPNETQFPESMIARGCVYLIDILNVDALGNFLSSTFAGNVTVGMGESGEPTSPNGPQVLQNIFDFGNVSFGRVDSIFQNVSDSITNYIRENGNVNHSAPAIGLVLHDQTCVQVRWWWLAFPVVLVVLTIVFFAAMVIQTRRGDHPKHEWKSSPLPLVFHKLERDTQDPNEDIVDINEMEGVARRLHVRLNPGKAWSFTEVT